MHTNIYAYIHMHMLYKALYEYNKAEASICSSATKSSTGCIYSLGHLLVLPRSLLMALPTRPRLSGCYPVLLNTVFYNRIYIYIYSIVKHSVELTSV